MSRSGDEMLMELSKLLGKQEIVSTAAKKEEKSDELEDKKDKEEEGKDKEDKEKKDEEDKKEDKEDKKDDKKDKKAVVMSVLNDLTKLASDLDNVGALDASSAVDDALRAIVKDLKS